MLNWANFEELDNCQISCQLTAKVQWQNAFLNNSVPVKECLLILDKQPEDTVSRYSNTLPFHQVKDQMKVKNGWIILFNLQIYFDQWKP